MNIKSNEILLFNKIKMEGEKDTNTATLEPIADEASAEKGMNALMFQGMKNLMSNPELAKDMGLADDIEPKTEGDNAEKYVAPFKSNLAFGHKFNLNDPKLAELVKKYGTKALAGLFVAGGVTTMESCKPYDESVYVNQEVTVDMDQFTKLMAQMLAMMSQMNAKLDKLDDQTKLLQQMQQTLLEILAAINNNTMTMEEGFNELFAKFIVNQANQELILQQLIDNGMKQEDANALIQQLIKEVQSGNKSAQDAWKEIIAKLGITNDLLNNIYNTIKASFAKLIQQGNEANKLAKGILDNTAAANDKLDKLNETTGSVVVELGNLIIANETMSTNIQAAIAQQTLSFNANVNSNIAALAKAVHMDIEDFKATMVRMGITEMQMQKMSVYELLEAINKNTDEIKDVKKIVNQLLVEYQAGRLSAEEFAQKIIEAMTQMNATLADISATLKDAYAKLNEIHTDAKDAVEKIISNQDRSYNMLTKLVDNTDGMKEQLDAVIAGQEAMTARIEKAIEESTLSQNANVASCMAEVAAVVRMSVDDLKAEIVRMGITEMQLQTMSVAELLKAINRNTDAIKSMKESVNTFLEEYRAGRLSAEEFAQKVLDILKQMDAKLGTILAELRGARADIYAKLDEISKSTSNIDANTQVISDKLDVVIEGQEAAVTRIEDAIKASTISQNDNVNANFEKLAGIVNMTAADFRALLKEMHISDQLLLTMSVGQLLDAINKNTEEVKNIRADFNTFVELYKSGAMTALEFANKIVELLDNIGNKLDTIIAELKNARSEIAAKLDEISKSTSNIDANTQVIGDKLDVVIKGQEAIKTSVTEAINNGVVSINDNVNANFDKLAGIVNMTSAEFKALLKDMHISDQDLLTMSVSKLLDAIKANTNQVKGFRADFNKFVELYKSGAMTAQEFANKIVDLLADMSGKLDAILAEVKGARAEMYAKLDEIKDAINASASVLSAKIDANGTVIANKLDIIIKGQNAAVERIEKAIEDNAISQNANVNVNFEKLAELVGMTSADFKAFLGEMNISNQQLQSMSVAKLLDAIKANTDKISGLKASFDNFYSQYLNHAITAKEFAEKIIDLLDQISGKLDKISGQIDKLYNDLMTALNKANKTLTNIDINTAVSAAYLNELNENVKAVQAAQQDYKQDLADLKQLAKDNNTYQSEILAELKSQPDKYKDMLNKLGITVTQAINMSAEQFSAKIDAAMAKYDNTEGKQTGLLVDIYNEMKNHQGQTFDDTNIIAAINALKAALGGDVVTINAKLEALLGALKDIGDKLDTIISQIGQLYNDVMDALKTANKNLVDIKTDSNNNFAVTNAYLSKLNNSVNDLKEKAKDYTQQLEDIKNNTKETLKELQSHPEKYQAMLDLLGLSITQAMSLNEAQLEAKINAAITNYNQTDGKQTELLVDIYNELKNHQGQTFDDTNIIAAINALKAALGGDVVTINAKLEALLGALKDIGDKLDTIISQIGQFYNDVMDALKTANKNLVDIKTDNNNNFAVTNAYLSKLNNSVNDLKEKAKDYTQQLEDIKNNTKETLKELQSHPEKYQAMLDILGLSITQAMNLNEAQLEAKINAAITNYNQTEGKQTELLDKIYNELKNHQGGTIDNSEVVAAINALKADMNADSATVVAKLQAILDALQDISGKLDDLIAEVKDMANNIRQLKTYASNFNTNFLTALGKLDDYAADLADIKALLAAGNANTTQINAKMDELNTDLKAMKSSLAKAEAFLNGIKTNGDIIINKLNQYENVDYDKLEQIMKGISDTDYQRYKELLESLAIDPAQFESVKDLIAAIKNRVEVDVPAMASDINKIYNLLKDVDWTKPDYTAKLQEIIDKIVNIKCTCECKCTGDHSGGNPDEGGHGIDDLDDLING